VTKPNKKHLRKELWQNNRVINTLLETHTREDMPKIYTLFQRNKAIDDILHPKKPSQIEDTSPENEALKQLEARIYGKTEVYCSNCGAPNGHNLMNGKEWCFSCSRIFEAGIQPKLKVNPQLKVSSEEKEAFNQRIIRM
jgi:hypothetical protein